MTATPHPEQPTEARIDEIRTWSANRMYKRSWTIDDLANEAYMRDLLNALDASRRECETARSTINDACAHARRNAAELMQGTIDGIGAESERRRVMMVELTNERDAARAEVAVFRTALEDFAERDCSYRDQCPTFGAGHGQCDRCKAREALAAGRKAGVR